MEKIQFEIFLQRNAVTERISVTDEEFWSFRLNKQRSCQANEKAVNWIY